MCGGNGMPGNPYPIVRFAVVQMIDRLPAMAAGDQRGRAQAFGALDSVRVFHFTGLVQLQIEKDCAFDVVAARCGRVKGAGAVQNGAAGIDGDAWSVGNAGLRLCYLRLAGKRERNERSPSRARENGGDRNVRDRQTDFGTCEPPSKWNACAALDDGGAETGERGRDRSARADRRWR